MLIIVVFLLQQLFVLYSAYFIFIVVCFLLLTILISGMNYHHIVNNIYAPISGFSYARRYVDVVRLLPQAYKIYILRDASSVSRIAMLIFASGSTLWTLYGFLLFDWVIILSFVFGMIGAWLIFILTFIYE